MPTKDVKTAANDGVQDLARSIRPNSLETLCSSIAGENDENLHRKADTYLSNMLMSICTK